MLIGLLRGIGILYYWTWFIYPFAFVFSLAYGIANIITGKESPNGYLMIASISLLIILSAITGSNFM